MAGKRALHWRGDPGAVSRKRRPPRRPMRSVRATYLGNDLPPYDPSVYPEEDLHHNTDVGQLGDEPIDGWTFELVYRYAIYVPEGLNVDWAIMTYAARRLPGEPSVVERRIVERIDCCHSELHIHSFRRSDDPADDTGRKIPLTSLSAGDAVIVSREYDVQMALHSREWRQRAWRWLDG
jgi:hypothetical protein